MKKSDRHCRSYRDDLQCLALDCKRSDTDDGTLGMRDAWCETEGKRFGLFYRPDVGRDPIIGSLHRAVIGNCAHPVASVGW